MRRAAATKVTRAERRELLRWTRARRRSPRLAARARVVLAAARGGSNSEIARRLRIAPETVRLWRERFRAVGVDGLRREAPRAGASTRVPRELVEQVLAKTVRGTGPGGRRWSTRSLARELRTNHMTVHRIWRAYGLGNEKSARESSPKVDLMGVYRSPGVSAIVFGVDGPTRVRPQLRPASAAGRPAPSSDPRNAADRLGEALRALPPPSRSTPSVSAEPGSLTVFLRSIEERTHRGTRLDALFDRPLEGVDERVARWLEVHPRYRIFTAGGGEEWIRSAETWLRRWESARLHARSFQRLHRFGSRAEPAAERDAAAGRDPVPGRASHRSGESASAARGAFPRSGAKDI